MLGALLFDLDGTLVDTNDMHARAWEEALRSKGYRVGFERLSRAMGIGGDQLVTEVLGEDAEEADGEAMRAVEKEVFGALLAKEGARMLPGTLALLHALRDRGLPTALATSSGEEGARQTLETAGIDAGLFRALICGGGALRAKPSPDVLVRACQTLGVAPAAVALVGDTLSDTRAARDAGIAVLGIAAGGHAEALRREGTRRLFTDPAHLLAVLDDTLRAVSPGPRVLTWTALDALLDAAFEQAELALARGAVPIGAVLAAGDGTLLASAQNRSSLGNDPVGHAEIVAFREAGAWTHAASDRVLASTLEPCVMCAGACMEVGLDVAVYGLGARDDGGVRRVRPPVSPENQTTRFVGPRQADRARSLFARFLLEHPGHPSCSYVEALLSSPDSTAPAASDAIESAAEGSAAK